MRTGLTLFCSVNFKIKNTCPSFICSWTDLVILILFQVSQVMIIVLETLRLVHMDVRVHTDT